MNFFANKKDSTLLALIALGLLLLALLGLLVALIPGAALAGQYIFFGAGTGAVAYGLTSLICKITEVKH